MKLIRRGTALNDLKAIISCMAECNVAAVRLLQDDIEACAERSPNHPFMYRYGRSPNTRQAVAHPNNVLISQVSSEAIEVLGVMHSRQRYP